MMDSDPRPLTIGFLRRGYSTSGGVEVYLKGLAGGLRASGHRVILFGTESWPIEAWPGGEILRCDGGSLATYIAGVDRHKRESGIGFDLILSVEKVPGCDLYRTDEGLHLAWLSERSSSITPWARWFQWMSPKHREKLALEKQLFRSNSTQRVISISEKISRDIVSYYGYPQEQITMIRNGVPQQGVFPDQDRLEARKALGISPDEKVILFVGTGWERKGLRTAIRAVESVARMEPKIKLLVAGKGSERRYASPWAKFLGPVQEMKSVYAAGDLYITPTIYEPFSLAALEALSAGIPVITSAAAGISEIMTPGIHGEIIPNPRDVDAFASALQTWLLRLKNPNLLAGIKEECSKLASQFTLERNLSETISLINEVIEEKKEGAAC
jgi:UDP-glucose:(heptosyl)LPS alpha-1,3-glucosyltransferase